MPRLLHGREQVFHHRAPAEQDLRAGLAHETNVCSGW
jgi:hypothetical protein